MSDEDLFRDNVLEGLPDDIEIELVERDSRQDLLSYIEDIQEDYEIYHMDHSRSEHAGSKYGGSPYTTYSVLIAYGEVER